jgi:anti-sigma factor RsiW
MTTDDRETIRDEKLRRLLRKWEAPSVPDGLDERVLEAYRRQTGTRQPLWKRLLTSSIQVPLPVAMMVALLLAVAVALALQPAPTAATAVAPETSGPVRAVQREAPLEPEASLAGFQPVGEITATVVREGRP